MLDLEPRGGLPMWLQDDGQIVFGPDVIVEERTTRPLERLGPVALQPESLRDVPRDAAYYMYNGIFRQADADALASNRIRYEITVVPPRRLGREYVKTIGHLHNSEPRSGETYVEVCEVLAGTAHFVMQTLDMRGPSASAAYYVEATAGQKVVVPPGLDHLTINPGPDILVFSDIIDRRVQPIYDRFHATHGAAYLEVANGPAPRFIANPHYRAVPPLRKIAITDYPGVDLRHDLPLYTAFARLHGEAWSFLSDPRQFGRVFPDIEAAFASPETHDRQPT